MATLKTGDIAALISGSPRMAVETAQDGTVSVVWCNEGTIHRDTFPEALLKKWEAREGGNDRGGRPSFDKGGRGGDRGNDRGDRGEKTGWHGKPREKTHFRKD